MSTPATTAPATGVSCIALVGNPNTGKSTLFSALSGVHQRVGNYPGVTVEKKIGHMTHDGRRLMLVDLPGTYSLAPRSPDEMVTVDVLLGRRDDMPRPDAVLCIVDASNLERNLYVVSQVLELELPTVVALNMIDVAQGRGIEIDAARLERQLGVKVVPVQANRRVGIEALKSELAAAARQPRRVAKSPFPEPFQNEVARLHADINGGDVSGDKTPRFLVERLLLDTSGYLANFAFPSGSTNLQAEVTAARDRLKQAGLPVPAVEAMSRYGWVARILEGVVKRPSQSTVTRGDAIDRVLTHPVLGSLIFIVMMFVVFQSVFRWPAPQLMELIDGATGWVAGLVDSALAEGPLKSLLVNGVIGGVGGVIIFLPQIMLLFLFIGLLEDCGYMARAAYLMDKLMSRVGLSGKSFIPLLSSFACAIPGVMAARVIENRRDRLTTILVAPLMSCSARLPVYVLFSAAFVPDMTFVGGLIGLHGLVMMAMYLVGMLAAVIVAWTLKKSLLRGPTPPFVLELPSYKWPDPRIVLHRMFERGWAFVQRAGTLIVAVSIVVWAASYYPRDPAVAASFAPRLAALEAQLNALPAADSGRAEVQAQLDELVQVEMEGEFQRQSYLGRIGHWIEPVVRPLGWDWRIGCAAVASFPAREVIVATLGVIYNVGGDVDVEEEESRGRLVTALREAKWDGTDRPVFNLPVALSIMVFFALCAQCASTLVIIKRETNSWRWPAFTFTYMTGLAYIAALVTYQTGMWLSG